jgi:hypothetical protein
MINKASEKPRSLWVRPCRLRAAKDLDNSPHAKDAFIMKQEEHIKQYDMQRVQIERLSELDKQKSLFDDSQRSTNCSTLRCRNARRMMHHKAGAKEAADCTKARCREKLIKIIVQERAKIAHKIEQIKLKEAERMRTLKEFGP